MFDRYNRNITYLRISVTDRCNLRCVYCMPAGGIQLLKKEEILSLEEIAEVVKVGAELGIKKVRLTGGEPLVRKGVTDLVAMISAIDGIEEVTMTTNGVLLSKYAAGLKEAGLSRVNISLDSVSSEKYSKITRGGKLQDVFTGIRAAQKAGLTPIKINAVKLKNENNEQFDEIRKFAADEELKLRFITQMDLRTGEFSQVEGGEGGNCVICNRLRLTANGMIKPCLFSNKEYNIREYGIKEAFLLALNAKPKEGAVNSNGSFYNIGG
ncbi:GTP 3',8-cyclase MoaA [Mariniphaga sp.]|uniref:GTP 3',8-cyclase MoaA n=1 Tax=Mariniphaga sp. TaxID=1954475 RepID=UPI003567CAF6